MKPGTLNAERLLALYERVADAPDAIRRLRRFVLYLAVTGKLVVQDPTDESPADLLAKARRNLKAKAETAKRARWKQTAPVTPDEIDKNVPSGWVPARVNDTGLYINGLAFKPANWKQSGVPIIRIQNLTDPGKEFNYAEGEFPDEVMVRNGDLLVSWSATLEAFNWERGDGVLNQHIFRVVPDEQLTSRDFLLLLLRNAIREMADSEHAHGLVMTHINRGPFLSHIVLIPPRAEQHRIVEKVEQLMALLDRLEAARTTAEAARDRLTAASLTRLTAPDTAPEVFRAHAGLALDALPALTTRPDQTKALRQTILNLAVRGKLVEQDPNDEQVSELLQRIEERRKELASAQGVRKKKPVEPLANDDALNLPVGWAAEALANLIDPTATISYGVLVPGPDVEEGIPFVRAQDLMLGDHPEKPSKTIASEIEARYARTRLSGDEILLCVVGSIGKLGVAPPHWAGANIARAVARISPVDLIDRDYLLVFLRSDRAQGYFEEATRTLAQPTLNVGLIEKLPVPLPPFTEQHRIVAKVDDLMALCDRLEAALATSDTTKQRLLESLLHEALSPAATPREVEVA